MLSSYILIAGILLCGLAAGSVDRNHLATRASPQSHSVSATSSGVFRRASEPPATLTPWCDKHPPKASDNNGVNQQLTVVPGIDAADCVHALAGFLKKKNGDWIIQINPTNAKSCRTCQVRLTTTDHGPMWIPLPTVYYGVADDLNGGLSLLLNTCPGTGGNILLAGGSATGGEIVVRVAKGSGKNMCGRSNETAPADPAQTNSPAKPTNPAKATNPTKPTDPANPAKPSPSPPPKK